MSQAIAAIALRLHRSIPKNGPFGSLCLRSGGAIAGWAKFSAPVTGAEFDDSRSPRLPGRSGVRPPAHLSDSGAGNGPLRSSAGVFRFPPSRARPTRVCRCKTPSRRRLYPRAARIWCRCSNSLAAVAVGPERWAVWTTPSTVIDPGSRGSLRGSSAGLVGDRDICWRSISKDNITTWYGKTPSPDR
jgi:hypothetical protein